MEIDQSLLESLPIQQRIRICKKLRQKQVQQYNEWSQNEPKQRDKKGKKNKKGTTVKFSERARILDAATQFDDREVLQLLKAGVQADIGNGSGFTLLHKCCLLDNLSLAEILIDRGANVNAHDDDHWSPLHVACACDHSDIVHLLLNNGANFMLLDVDGNFAVDHAPPDSESRQILLTHIQKHGIQQETLQDKRLFSAKQMYSDVKALTDSGGNIDTSNENGVTLLHIACVNGYCRVVKLLLNSNADLNAQDDAGWTPLHLAAKYGQLKVVKLLIRRKANPHITNEKNMKPSSLAASSEIAEALMKAEASAKQTQNEDHRHESEDMEDDNPALCIRVNSKTMRPIHLSPLSKKEELNEGKMRLGRQDTEELVEESEEFEDIYETLSFVTGSFESTVIQDKLQISLPAVLPSDDLAKLAELTESRLLTELQSRWMKGHIYTYIGDILVAVNPFKQLPIYSPSVCMQYHDNTDMSRLPPHIYAIASQAYQALLTQQKSQCCVLSGESGSGKTESSKYIVQHLLSVAHSEEGALNVKIQQVNPLLEAFGNAKTVMNHNSSRFGKYIEIMIGSDGRVLGAKINEYLLEKSRVVYQAAGEFNYHIFYLLFSGLSPDECRKFGLQSASRHRYLSSEGLELSSSVMQENREKFTELRRCLQFIGFTNSDVENLLTLLSVVLHIGDIQFKAVGNNDAAEIVDMQHVSIVAEMLQIPVEELAESLVAEYTITRGEQIKKERSVLQSCDCRDALAKSLYGRLFSWIVNGINQFIQPAEDSGPSIELGILDLFGFENFPKNSLEQICINVANEQLQQYFCEFIFQQELEECTYEQVSVSDVDFTTNKTILDLFLQRHTGIFAVLDEESHFPKATDKSLASKLHKGPGQLAPQIYLTPRDGGTCFTIMHYAGKVTYDLSGLLHKNRDTLPNSVMFTMKTSNSLIVKEIFQSRISRTGSLAPTTRQRKSRKSVKPKTKSPFDFFRRKKATQADRGQKGKPIVKTERKLQTVTNYFKNSLTELIAKLTSAQPHFVRCLKPNMSRTSNNVDSNYLCTQLRYTGLIETVKIRRNGYSMRILFSEFLERYDTINLCCIPSKCMLTDMQKCKKALEKCGIQDNKVGKTKLFFRYWHVEKLAEISCTLEKNVIISQKVVRGKLGRLKFARLATVKARQNAFVSKFLNAIEMNISEICSELIEQHRENFDHHHEQKVQLRRKREEMNSEEIRKSIEALDSILDEYDDDRLLQSPAGDGVFIIPSPPTAHQATKMISSFFCHGQVSSQHRDSCEEPLPPPPPELMLDRMKSYKGSLPPPPPEFCQPSPTVNDPFDVAVPPPDYDDAPESGYISPDQQSSGSEFDRHILAVNRVHGFHTGIGQPLSTTSSGFEQESIKDASPLDNKRLSGSSFSMSHKEHQRETVQYRQSHVIAGDPVSSAGSILSPSTRGCAELSEYSSATSAQEQTSEQMYFVSSPSYTALQTEAHTEHLYSVPLPTQNTPLPQPPSHRTHSRPPPSSPAQSMQGRLRPPPAPPFDVSDTPPPPSFAPPPPPGRSLGNLSTTSINAQSSNLNISTSIMQTASKSSSPHQTLTSETPPPPPPLSLKKLPPATKPKPKSSWSDLPGSEGFSKVEVCRPPPSVLFTSQEPCSGVHVKNQRAPPPPPPATCMLGTAMPPPSPAAVIPPPPPPPPCLTVSQKSVQSVGAKSSHFVASFPLSSSSVVTTPLAPPPLPSQSAGFPSNVTTRHPPPPPPPPPPQPPVHIIPKENSGSDFLIEQTENTIIQATPPPPPPPPPLLVPSSEAKPGSLLSGLQNIKLKKTSPPDTTLIKEKTKPPASSDSRSDLIAQIQAGIKLRPSPVPKMKSLLSSQEEVVVDSKSSEELTSSVDNSAVTEASPPMKIPPPLARKAPKPPAEVVADSKSSVELSSSFDNSAVTETSPPVKIPPSLAPKAPKPPAGTTPKMPTSSGQKVDNEDIVLDPTTLLGYQEVPENCPAWKKAMIERKNKELEENAKKEYQKIKEEETKWKDIPEWRKKLIMEKEKKKTEELAPVEEERKKKEEDLSKLQSMPDWKRNLLLKKRGDNNS